MKAALAALGLAAIAGMPLYSGDALGSEWITTVVAPGGGSTAGGDRPGIVAMGERTRFEINPRSPAGCDPPSWSPGRPAAADGLPDGAVARFISAGGTFRAWYVLPTRRYRHGVLGDAVEAGGLRLVLPDGVSVEHALGPDQVFEDLTPRLADVDRDGVPEVLAILSDRRQGASLAVYKLDRARARLDLMASTGFIGTPNRWLNPIGIADFNGDGRADVALVRTPHIGGMLEIWTFEKGGLVLVASRPGHSNHAIGSRVLHMAAVADLDGDGAPELVVPDDTRTRLSILAVAGNRIRPLAGIDLPGRIVSEIGFGRDAAGAPVFALRTDARQVIVLSRRRDRIPVVAARHCRN